MANIFLKLLFAHWLTFFDALQRFFRNYTPQPLLSTVFPGRIEDSSKSPPIVHVPQFRDPLDHVNSVDAGTSCLLPTIFQPPLTMKFYCTPDYDLDDAASAELSHYYAFSDIPVWRPVDPDAASPPHVEDDYVQTNMIPYGARGLSFCPVLVGIIYVHSLLHLYMLLMVPSLFNHWFEDTLDYESLDPRGILDCSWILHASLWMAPWRLLRYGMHKVIPCVSQRVQRSTHKLDHSPIPSIVLIRVDGEAVPVICAEDHHEQVKANADTAIWSPSLESVDLDMGDGRAVASKSEEPRPFFGFSEDNCITTELTMRASSHQGEVAKAEVSLIVADKVPDQRPEDCLIVVRTEKFPWENVLILSIPNTPIATTGDSCDVDERTDKFEHIASLESATNGVWEDSDENLREHLAFSPWGLDDNQTPNGMQTSTEIATGLSVGSQDILTPVKNVQFTIGDDAGAALADRDQVSSSTSCTEEQSTCAWTRQLGDDDIGSAQIPAIPFDLRMEPEQVFQPVPPMAFDEKEAATTRIELVQPLSPEKLVVNLPSLVTRREDVQFVDMVPMVLAALIEDVATCSPHLTFFPTVPTVALNMKRIVEANGQSLYPPKTEELVQDAADLNNNAVTYGKLDIVSARRDGSYPPTPSFGDLDPASSPIADTKPLGDSWTPIILSTSATVCGVGMPATKADNDNASPKTMMELPGTNKLEAEVLCETSLYSLRGNIPTRSRSVQDGLQGPDVNDSGTTMHLSPFSPKEPETPDETNVMDPGGTDSMTIAPSGFSCAVAIGLATVELASPCKDANPLAMTSMEKIAGEMDDENSHETNTALRNPASMVSKPAPGRTLSDSMHAPSENLQPNTNIDGTPVSSGTPLLLTDSELLAETDRSGARKSTTTRNELELRQDLFASIHAPQRISNVEVRSPAFQLPDELRCGHRRFSTNTSIVSDRRPVTKPYSPNWAAMPDVVDAFRAFKEAPTRRGISSIAEGVLSRKGVATNSLNSTSATANIHSRWMQGNGLPLVRDVVSSDPADFDLRACTNLRTSKIHNMINARSVEGARCPGFSSFELQSGIMLRPVPVNTHLSSMPVGVRHQQGMLLPRNSDVEPILGSQRWTAYRG